jgi:hypothetical protein
MHTQRIENQIAATGLPLVSITPGALPRYPGDPDVALALRQGKLAPVEGPGRFVRRCQLRFELNDRWRFGAVDSNAGSGLGAGRVGRCPRRAARMHAPGADTTEAFECLQAFGASLR